MDISELQIPADDQASGGPGASTIERELIEQVTDRVGRPTEA